MPKFLHENLGAVCETVFVLGTITEVYEDDTADVDIVDPAVSAARVPIYYHCSHDAELRSNGALEASGTAFAAGDEVIVRGTKAGQAFTPVHVVAHSDGEVRACGTILLMFCMDNTEPGNSSADYEDDPADLADHFSLLVWDVSKNRPAEIDDGAGGTVDFPCEYTDVPAAFWDLYGGFDIRPDFLGYRWRIAALPGELIAGSARVWPVHSPNNFFLDHYYFDPRWWGGTGNDVICTRTHPYPTTGCACDPADNPQPGFSGVCLNEDSYDCDFEIMPDSFVSLSDAGEWPGGVENPHYEHDSYKITTETATWAADCSGPISYDIIRQYDANTYWVNTSKPSVEIGYSTDACNFQVEDVYYEIIAESSENSVGSVAKNLSYTTTTYLKLGDNERFPIATFTTPGNYSRFWDSNGTVSEAGYFTKYSADGIGDPGYLHNQILLGLIPEAQAAVFQSWGMPAEASSWGGNFFSNDSVNWQRTGDCTGGIWAAVRYFPDGDGSVRGQDMSSLRRSSMLEAGLLELFEHHYDRSPWQYDEYGYKKPPERLYCRALIPPEAV